MESLLRPESVLVSPRRLRASGEGSRWRRRAWEAIREGKLRKSADLQLALVSSRLSGGARAALRDRFRLLRLQLVLGDWEGALANIEVLYGRLARRGILGGAAAGWVFLARATAQFQLGQGARFRRSLATVLRGARRGPSRALRTAAFQLAAANAVLAGDPDRPLSPRVRAAQARASRESTRPNGPMASSRRRAPVRWSDGLASIPGDHHFAWTPESFNEAKLPPLSAASALARWVESQAAERNPVERSAVHDRLSRLAASVREPWARACLLEALAESALWISAPNGCARPDGHLVQARADLGLAAGLFRRLGWPERAARCEQRWARLALPIFAAGVAEGAVAGAVSTDVAADPNKSPVYPEAGRSSWPLRRPHPARVRAALQEIGFLTGDQRVLQDLAPLVLLSSSPLPVLIQGESGTGKELIARAVHRWSRLRGGFVPIHCGAIPRDLLESELFGHTRGAFTGAAGEKPGLIEAADGGTLFLDEIGEMGVEAQMKMLRVLENGEVRRLGDLASRRASIRLVAATHRDLAAEIDQGRFRLDLYHRIRGLIVRLRPLRERRGDIPLLAARFLAQGGPPLGLTSEAMAGLLAHDWPGNVRELRSTLQQAAHLARAIGLASLPAEFLGLERLPARDGPSVMDDGCLWPGELKGRVAFERETPANDPASGREPPADRSSDLGSSPAPSAFELEDAFPPGGFEAHLESIERRYILRALDAQGWNRTRAARSLGEMSRTTLLSKMKRLGIVVPEGEEEPRPAEDGCAPRRSRFEGAGP